MKIAGFFNGHDCSFCILEDGVPIIHAEYERYLRLKEPTGDSWGMLLDIVGEFDDIDYFVSVGAAGYKTIFRNKKEWKKDYPECIGRAVPDLSKQINDPKVKEQLSWRDNEMITIGHHKCHAAAAFYSSNLDESLIITIDGGGREEASDEFPSGQSTSRTVWFGQNNKIHPIDLGFKDSISMGQVWSLYTGKVFGLSTGYPYGHSAGTVMGMAALGDRNKYIKQFDKSSINCPKCGWNVICCCFAKEIAEKGNEQDKFDIAASLQYFTEKLIEKSVANVIDSVPKELYKNLCLSGGVSLNCVMLGKLIEKFDFDHIHVDPVPYDGGLVLGAAQYTYYHLLENKRVVWEDNFSPYLGETYDEKSVWFELDKVSDKISYEIVDDDHIVDLLDKQNIISVFGGGSESGRRALGNRSILADPRSNKIKDIINKKVKHRQWFRPFAPSILREEVKNWFVYDIDSPYMNFAIPFKDSVKEKVPAVVHYDGTVRLQTVTENDNKWYYNLIKKFQDKTDIPILLNTSFNDREPIVETPEDAVNCFLKTDIDYLYFYEFGILGRRK